MTISFVIPVYNEEKRLNKTFEALRQAQGKLPSGLKLENVTFVDDGSTDRSRKMLSNVIARNSAKQNNEAISSNKKIAAPFGLAMTKKVNVKLISYNPNKGKGFAVRTGILASPSDYTLFFDADMSTPLSEIKKFVPFMEKDIDVIVGTRKNGESTVLVHQSKFREFLGRTFTSLAKFILQIKVTDFTCGFKAFSRNAKDTIFYQSFINGWGYDAEILFLAKKKNLTIIEKPVIWSNINGSKVKLYKAIPQTIYELFQIQWNHAVKPFFNQKLKAEAIPS